MRELRVLIACEFSGIVREAFRKLGHDAYSCDLLPAEDKSFYHYQFDIRSLLKMEVSEDWDLIIAHPPCTYLCNSGVQHLSKQAKRWEQMQQGAIFFRSLLNANCEHIAIENPIPHKYAVEIIGKQYDQLIQPYQFGHRESKATCFWLKGLPKLIPTSDLKEETKMLPKNQSQRLHYLPPGVDRAKERSRTYTGIAKAMAVQWSEYILGLRNEKIF
jgi:hypothetical protein